jgi:putative ABC transport system permease protein
MFFNYFKTALRSLLRQRANVLINLSGLTLGIASSLVLFLMVMYQSSFDTYHTNKDRIYRVVQQSDGNHGKNYQGGVQAVLPEAIRNDFPEAEQVTFASYRSDALVVIPQRNGESKKYQEERGVVYAESNFFKIFDRGVLTGSLSGVLDNPNEAVISKGLAKKYFGREDVVGEVVSFENQPYKINAVVENAPAVTDLPFDLFLSYVTIKKQSEEDGWSSIWSDEQCFVLLKEGEDVSKAQARMPAFATKYVGKENRNHVAFSFQPLAEVHFDDRYSNFSYNTVSKGMLTTLSAIVIILIVTACINFINLSTAEAIKRSKEVGIRKTLGSSRAQLILQFLGETTLVTLTAVMLALALVQLALTFINPYLETSLVLDLRGDGMLWTYLISVTVLVSLLSGLYPAFVISGFRPALALKNQIAARGTSSYTLRRSLVVLQFCISQFFIIGTIVIIQQMNYFNHKDLGFNKEAVLVAMVPYFEDAAERKQATERTRTLRNAMQQVPGVEMASLAFTPPSSGSISATNFSVKGVDGNFLTQVKLVDGNYVPLFGVTLIAGQNIEDFDTARSYVVNEKLARVAGFKDPKDIVGRELTLWDKKLPVVGVVKDFHTASLRSPVEATVLFNRAEGYESLSLKIDMRQAQHVIKTLQSKWEATYPKHLFEYHFLDDNIAEFYENEQRMSVFMGAFTAMAVFIGCLGLFGLATFMANQRTKEIGVRKVLGATVESIVLMFSKEFLKLVVIGFVLAAPLAWWIMNQFLAEFEYKIDLGPALFLTGFGVALFIAIVTVAYKSISAATRNPVQSLRYE